MNNDLTRLMIEKARQTLQYAYAPYSHYSVGCCVSSEDGSLWTGANVENASYGLSICAETAAISSMVNHGQTRIKHLVVLSGDNALCPPCGACRQRILEFSTPETQIHLCNAEGILSTLSIDTLLPTPFSLRK